MSDTQSEIMLTNEVMARLRYASTSAFYAFLKDKGEAFPLPFKLGRRNFWYSSEVEGWLEKKSQVRGLDTFSDERKAKMRGKVTE
ncbi:AlpA family transcriptional regulator [Rahnella sp. ChDrAdgB13]|uniref:helix-turn-helix transcriptional regulator n=1 Tax=Rahnella sp. ChDrAdgB13 TaxID=1850581 RepID=UPI001AD896EE|nr:hypothetical protein [Rahnella sp. ChDrAdgB13]